MDDNATDAEAQRAADDEAMHKEVQQALAPVLKTSRALLEALSGTSAPAQSIVDGRAMLAANKALADKVSTLQGLLAKESEARELVELELGSTNRALGILRARGGSSAAATNGADAAPADTDGGAGASATPVKKEASGTDDARARAQHAELQAELEAERGLHAKANAALEESRKELVSVRNELTTLRASLADESHVADTHAYRALGAQVAQAQHDMAEAQTRAQAAALKNAELDAEVARLTAEAGKVTLAQRGEQLAQRRLHEVESLLMTRTSERDTLRVQLEHEKGAGGGAAAASRADSLAKELEASKAEVERLRAKAGEAKAAIEALKEVQVLAEKATMAMHLANARVEELEAAAAAPPGTDALARENAELRLVCEALCSSSGSAAGGGVEPAVARLQEALAREAPAVSPDAAAELERERRRADEATATAAAAEERARLADASGAELGTEMEALAEEIETMSSLYEDAQEQVTTLTKQLAEREAALADQSAAQAREKNLLAAAEDAKRGAISQAQHASASAELARQESLDARTLLQNALKRAAEAERKLAEHQASVEAESRAAAESARRAEQARMTLTSVQKGAESARAAIAEAEHRVDAAVAAKEAAEADAERLRKRMDKLRRMTESDGNSLLQEQLKWYKDQVKCPIIRSENKEVCLIKCGHMYSRKCVDGLIQQRNRKCPACGTRFDKADVLPIYFGSNEAAD